MTSLGATWSKEETTFAVWSPDATTIHACLYDTENQSLEVQRHLMTNVDGTWSVTIPNVAPGTPYGFRAAGPYKPSEGLRFNPAKLLADPYARSLTGDVTWHPAVFGYPLGDEDSSIPDSQDSEAFVPKSVVIDPSFDWQGVTKPNIPIDETIVYEAHIHGLTSLHPAVPAELRGTYAGAAHPAIIEHLTKLGITAIEFLPIHTHVDDGFLVERGLVNYWGYSTLGFFSPEQSYASTRDPGAEVSEFKAMVREFHRAGIEVWLDVVYNHTAEANHQGPTLSFRGLANNAYYRLMGDDPSKYLNISGTGNTVNVFHPNVTGFVLDSLRYWAEDMGIDGFRFDLAPIIGRTESDFDRNAPIFQAIANDPILSTVKMIAEPWDLGEGGYQVGNFPDLWSEWNDKYRDNVRAFWRSDDSKLGELGYRLTGSADVYGLRPLGPCSSINFVAAHDGMTTWDVISFQEKRNHANGDNNDDGHEHEISQFIGPDGHTTDTETLSERFQRQRSLLATLLLSRGVPMLLGGDEIARTQQGNNNSYCQDNTINWIDWNLKADQKQLLDFVGKCAALRKAEPAFRLNRFPEDAVEGEDSWFWFIESGEQKSDEDWSDPERRSLGILLDAADGGHLIMLINAGGHHAHFQLPHAIAGREDRVELVLSTAATDDNSLTAAPGSLSVYRVSVA